MNGRYLHLPSDGGEPEMLAVYGDMDSLFSDIEGDSPCNVCGDPGRLVTDDGYAVSLVTDGFVMCDADDEAHASIRSTFGPRTEVAR